MSDLISETKLAILRDLTDGAKHGYALADDLDISKGAVYTHLQDLEEAGMVEVVEVQEEGRGKKIYELTDNGRLLVRAFEE